MREEQIRNFAIIAHIDHGKSTIADRLIEFCGGIEKRKMKNQILDSMEIEQERGITIKAQTVRLSYKAKSGITYQLNLMDTPGHVDFSYEVSRSLAACEGSLLVVDGTQGVQAQTIANVHQAIENDHEIITVINKSDLPSCNPARVKEEIANVLGIETKNAILVSAKEGTGIEELLEAIVKELPPSDILKDTAHSEELKALLIDSWYDKYLGVVILTRIFSGKITKNMKIKMLASNTTYTVDKIGFFSPNKNFLDTLEEGSIGFFTASIKSLSSCKTGDTITNDTSTVGPLKGFKNKLSVVFCSLYPTETSNFSLLKDALEKLKLNDSSLEYEIEKANSLGIGFRCGFLGLLHLEVTQERLEREFNLHLISTAPSVIYKVMLKTGQELDIHNPSDFPEVNKINYVKEPWIKANIIVPEKYLGPILQLCTEKRGDQTEMHYISKQQVMLNYNIPLNEIVFDFYDKLKGLSKGYASFDWSLYEYRKSDLVKLNILINGDEVEALSMIIFRPKSQSKARELCRALKNLIPRRLFQIPIQASIGSKIIARETVKAFRKDVTGKCYGGDVTRKKKLLEKQKLGKKKIATQSDLKIPKSVFIEALKIS